MARIDGLCVDETVIGSWFYVMEMVEGQIFWDATFPDVPRAERSAYFAAMNAAMARLGTRAGKRFSQTGRTRTWRRRRMSG